MKSIWIARDKDNELYAYKNKPFREIRGGLGMRQWTSESLYAYRLDKDWFPEVTWESGPIELVPTISLGGMSLEEHIKDLKEKLDIIELRKYVGVVDDRGNISLTNEMEDK